MPKLTGSHRKALVNGTPYEYKGANGWGETVGGKGLGKKGQNNFGGKGKGWGKEGAKGKADKGKPAGNADEGNLESKAKGKAGDKGIAGGLWLGGRERRARRSKRGPGETPTQGKPKARLTDGKASVATKGGRVKTTERAKLKPKAKGRARLTGGKATSATKGARAKTTKRPKLKPKTKGRARAPLF